jgi:exopolysaccharide biosynthesis polyprenyl glycosylphosphotransferase
VRAHAAPGSARILRRSVHAGRFPRIVVVGTVKTARSLKRELALGDRTRAAVTGCVTAERVANGDPDMPVLGTIADLRSLIHAHAIDLLVVGGEAPRVAVLDQAISVSDRSVRVCELSDFYEAVFGHVPTAEINASWFEYLVSPAYRESHRAKRVLDLVLASILALVFLPVVAALALAITLDGGSSFFRQVRIGERGRPITIWKLRTMRPGCGSEATWSCSDDPRVTVIGRFLRRTHLDELPQLLNVLRGEMSIVGPRPEQPEYVAQLERILPFYERRHLIKPGITGWAQIRCGYAGSDQGSAWKLCHDLFYMKYSSLRLDLLILLHTLRLVFSRRQPELEPSGLLAFVAASPAAGATARYASAASSASTSPPGSWRSASTSTVAPASRNVALVTGPIETTRAPSGIRPPVSSRRLRTVDDEVNVTKSAAMAASTASGSGSSRTVS